MLCIVRLSALCSIWDRELLPSPPAFQMVDGLIDATSKDWARPSDAKRQPAKAITLPTNRDRGTGRPIMNKCYPQGYQTRIVAKWRLVYVELQFAKRHLDADLPRSRGA